MRRRELVDARRDRNEAGSAKPNTLRHTSSQLAPDPDACAVGKVTNLVQLHEMAPDLPFIPMLQGYTRSEYEHCADLYATAGIDLTTEPLVGLGSVCRRQATKGAHAIVTALHARGITRLHGFGVKTLGLQRYGHLLTSADSLAWSFDARRLQRPSPWCTSHRTAKNCANCLPYALRWRTNLLRDLTP